jgi:hypothetical protein
VGSAAKRRRAPFLYRAKCLQPVAATGDSSYSLTDTTCLKVREVAAVTRGAPFVFIRVAVLFVGEEDEDEAEAMDLRRRSRNYGSGSRKKMLYDTIIEVETAMVKP